MAALYSEAMAAASAAWVSSTWSRATRRPARTTTDPRRRRLVHRLGARRQMILAATHQTPSKLVSLEMGGKNAALVGQDADLELTAKEQLNAAFITCGQRCTTTSQAYVHRSPRQLASLLKRSRKWL